MIKPIKVTPLNVTKTLEYRCSMCKDSGVINVGIISVDNDGNSEVPLENYDCPKCGERL